MFSNPRESGKFISANAEHIKILPEGVEKFGAELAKVINSGELSVENFGQTAVHPTANDPFALDWIFVVDTLNFCFWSRENEEGWKVDGYTGYYALCAAINRAMKEGIDISNPKFYSTITEEQLSKVLRSDNDVHIPLFKERLRCLHEVGEALLKNFEGSFENVVKKADKSAATLLKIVVDNFPCFRDQATFKGKNVSILKRAQILIGDIWACYLGNGIGHFNDIEEITMFADYRVPQTLLYYNVLEYSKELLEKLNAGNILENGEEMEVEIRGCSIHAVELLKEVAIKKIDKDKIINSILIDHFLWDFRRKHAQEILSMKLPFHKTFSIYY